MPADLPNTIPPRQPFGSLVPNAPPLPSPSAALDPNQSLSALSPAALEMLRQKYLASILDPTGGTFSGGTFDDTKTAGQSLRDQDFSSGKPSMNRLKTIESDMQSKQNTLPDPGPGFGRYFYGYNPGTTQGS